MEEVGRCRDIVWAEVEEVLKQLPVLAAEVRRMPSEAVAVLEEEVGVVTAEVYPKVAVLQPPPGQPQPQLGAMDDPKSVDAARERGSQEDSCTEKDTRSTGVEGGQAPQTPLERKEALPKLVDKPPDAVGEEGVAANAVEELRLLPSPREQEVALVAVAAGDYLASG